MKLSGRLETVASFVKKGSSVADIGTDHGYIPIWLTKEGIAAKVIAMDVRQGPLERAKVHVESCGLSHRITLRLGDGLEKLVPGEADCVIIAGMGGELVIHILEQGRHMWESVDRFVLSPQSDLDRVRRYLEGNGFLICREAMVAEDGKYYTVMEVCKGHMSYLSPVYYKYGKHLIKQKDPILGRYLEKEKGQYRQILEKLQGTDTPAAAASRERLETELMWIKEAEDEMR